MDANAVPHHVIPGLQAMNADKPLAKFEKTQLAMTVLDRYEGGEDMADIAKSYNLKAADQLYRLLIANAPDKWRDYQAARALRKLEDATKGLESAADGLSLARAREQVRAAQWELERLLRRLYGTDVPQNLTVPIQINIGIARQQKHENSTGSAQVIDVQKDATD